MDRSNDPRHDFYANPTVDELIAQQRKEPIRDPRTLLGDFWPEDEPIEEFLAALLQWRGHKKSGTIGRGANAMAHLIIEVTDDLARSLEGIAAAQHKSIQDLAIERLSSLVEAGSEHRAGSPAAVLRAMQSPPHPSASDVDELDEAIAGGRLPIRTRDLFPD